MSIAYIAGTDSHTGASGSVSEAQFTWAHATNSVAPKGVMVAIFQTLTGADTANYCTSVTYGGVDVPYINTVSTPGSSEPARVSLYFLGSGTIPSGSSETVVVNRTNNAVMLYAICTTYSSTQDCVLNDYQSWNGSLTNWGQATVSDLSNGQNSQFVMLEYCGYNNLIAAATGSSRPVDVDYGARTAAYYHKSTPTSGTTTVGHNQTTDWFAGMAFAIMDAPAATGRVYWVVYPSAQANPVAADIIAGTVTNGIHSDDLAPTADTVAFTGAQITGLTASTSYKLAAVWYDGTDTSNVNITAAFNTTGSLNESVTLTSAISLGSVLNFNAVATASVINGIVQDYATALLATAGSTFTTSQVMGSLLSAAAQVAATLQAGTVQGGIANAVATAESNLQAGVVHGGVVNALATATATKIAAIIQSYVASASALGQASATFTTSQVMSALFNALATGEASIISAFQQGYAQTAAAEANATHNAGIVQNYIASGTAIGEATATVVFGMSLNTTLNASATASASLPASFLSGSGFAANANAAATTMAGLAQNFSLVSGATVWASTLTALFQGTASTANANAAATLLAGLVQNFTQTATADVAGNFTASLGVGQSLGAAFAATATGNATFTIPVAMAEVLHGYAEFSVNFSTGVITGFTTDPTAEANVLAGVAMQVGAQVVANAAASAGIAAGVVQSVSFNGSLISGVVLTPDKRTFNVKVDMRTLNVKVDKRLFNVKGD